MAYDFLHRCAPSTSFFRSSAETPWKFSFRVDLSIRDCWTQLRGAICERFVLFFQYIVDRAVMHS